MQYIPLILSAHVVNLFPFFLALSPCYPTVREGIYRTQLIATKVMVVYILGYLNVVSVAVQKENFQLEDYCHRAEI